MDGEGRESSVATQQRPPPPVLPLLPAHLGRRPAAVDALVAHARTLLLPLLVALELLLVDSRLEGDVQGQRHGVVAPVAHLEGGGG